MRITCPTCSTQYDVDENDIAFTGQDVQCTECMTIWTQARDGEASNARLAGSLDDNNEDNLADDDKEDEATSEAEPVTEVIENADVPLEDARASTSEEEESEDPQDDKTEELEDTRTSDTADEDQGEIGDTEAAEEDEDENPVWKEIAALAQEARADSESESSTDSQYSPPDELPPIQSSPAVPDEVESSVDESDDEDRPWDVANETGEGFSDFVWNDPSDANNDEVELGDTSAEQEEDRPLNQGKSEFTPFTDASGGLLEKMDDDLIAAALDEQMAIEDALEDAPRPTGRNISDVPVELGGPLARKPNVEALKNSVRSKSVKMTSEELQEQVPARRFRRGFTLILLTFVILGAIYISRGTITEYLPAAGPYLETYANFVDLLRVKAEVLGIYVWGLMTQGYDWVIAKFF